MALQLPPAHTAPNEWFYHSAQQYLVNSAAERFMSDYQLIILLIK